MRCEPQAVALDEADDDILRVADAGGVRRDAIQDVLVEPRFHCVRVLPGDSPPSHPVSRVARDHASLFSADQTGIRLVNERF